MNIDPCTKPKTVSPMHSDADPDGSYTGVPSDPCEMPRQDADDL